MRIAGLALLLLANRAGAQPAPELQAFDRPRLAALIAPVDEREAQQAADLTEVLIAALAKHGFDLAGAEEFRARLGMEHTRDAIACIENAACLARAGVALGVTKVAAGTLGRRNGQSLFSLSLVNISTGEVEGQAFALITGGMRAVVDHIRTAVARVLEPQPKPGGVRVESATKGANVYVDDVFSGTTPVLREGLEPGPHRLRVEKTGHHGWANQIDVPAGNVLDIKLSLETMPKRRRWPAYVAWASLASAVVAGATGLFFGVLADQEPTSSTRAGFAQELDTKEGQALTANILFGTAGALAIASGLTFWIYSDDVFGKE